MKKSNTYSHSGCRSGSLINDFHALREPFGTTTASWNFEKNIPMMNGREPWFRSSSSGTEAAEPGQGSGGEPFLPSWRPSFPQFPVDRGTLTWPRDPKAVVPLAEHQHYIFPHKTTLTPPAVRCDFLVLTHKPTQTGLSSSRKQTLIRHEQRTRLSVSGVTLLSVEVWNMDLVGGAWLDVAVERKTAPPVTSPSTRTTPPPLSTVAVPFLLSKYNDVTCDQLSCHSLNQLTKVLD